MEFRILGPLEVRSGGCSVDIGGAGQRLLLARLLVAYDRVVSVDELVEQLTLGTPSTGARDALHTRVSRLRKTLRSAGRGDVLKSKPSGYALDVGVDELDAARFQRLVVHARQAAADGKVSSAIEMLRSAESCWHGSALGEFLDYPFAQAESARLDELRLATIEDRIDAELAAGRHNELPGELEALVAAHPLRERLWGQLMLALYRSGRQSEALRAHQRLRHHLGDELGIEPGPDVAELERAMLLHDPTLDLPTIPVVAGIATARPSHGNLPSALTSFVGRGEERCELTHLLADSRLLTLTGPGGVGKTRLALEVARGIDGYPDGVWLVELAPVTDPALVPQALARAVGVGEQPRRAITDTLVESLRLRRLLVVLDNCEHLVAACAALSTTLLEACPDLRILATSRVSLRVAGELVWPVSPLSVPDERRLTSAAEVMDNDSASLLLDRARSVRPHLFVVDADVPAIKELCARLEGIPLAIELAAARVSILSLQQLAARLDECLQLCATTATSTAPRHRSLYATLEWSYHLLSSSEQALLRGLSVFAGGCTLEALEALWKGEPDRQHLLDHLGSLVEGSLVVTDDDGRAPRYRLLEVVRQYAAGKLDLREATARRRRHRDLYLAWAEEAEPLAWGVDPGPAIDGLVAEHDNLRAALSWSLQAPSGDDGGLRLAYALYPLWFCSGLFREGRQWLEAFLARGSSDLALMSAVTRRAGLLAREGDDYSAAALLTQRALTLARDVGGPPHILARAMMTAGAIAGVVGDVATERSLLEQALPIARAHDGTFVAICLSSLACAAHRQGRYREGRELSHEILAKHPREWVAVGNALHVLGQIEREQDSLQSARSHLERAFALDVEAGQVSSAHFLSVELGTVAWAGGDRDAAHDHWERALALSREHGAPDFAAAALVGLAEIASADRNHELALALADEAAPTAETIGDVYLAASVLSRLGDVRAEAGQTDAAEAAYRRALSLAHRCVMPWHLAACLEGLAYLALARCQAEEAARLLGAAGAVRASVGSVAPHTVLPSVEDRTRAATAVLGRSNFDARRAEGARDIPAVVTRYRHGA